MKVSINGKARDVEEGTSIQDLVLSLQLKPGRIAVERNREIIGREQWESVRVEEGDRYEIVHFVGGG